MAQANLDANQINVEDHNLISGICDMDECDWYKDVIYYLQNMKSPSHLINNERNTVKLHAIRYIIVNRDLSCRNFKGMLLKCIDQ